MAAYVAPEPVYTVYSINDDLPNVLPIRVATCIDVLPHPVVPPTLQHFTTFSLLFPRPHKIENDIILKVKFSFYLKCLCFSVCVLQISISFSTYTLGSVLFANRFEYTVNVC